MNVNITGIYDNTHGGPNGELWTRLKQLSGLVWQQWWAKELGTHLILGGAGAISRSTPSGGYPCSRREVERTVTSGWFLCSNCTLFSCLWKIYWLKWHENVQTCHSDTLLCCWMHTALYAAGLSTLHTASLHWELFPCMSAIVTSMISALHSCNSATEDCCQTLVKMLQNCKQNHFPVGNDE